MSQRLLVLLSVLPLLAQHSYPQEPDITVKISVFAARQETAPLKVVRFRTVARKDGPRLILQNTSDRPITSFLLGATVSSPCSSRTPVKVHHLGWRWQTIVLEPKHQVESKENLLAPVGLLSFLPQDEQPYLHVQVGVAEVQLADGTVWKAPFDDQHFTASLVSQDSVRCAALPMSHWQSALSSVKFVQKTKTRNGIGIAAQPNGQLGYLLTCSSKGTEAYCPVD